MAATSTLPIGPPEEKHNPGQEEYKKLTRHYNPDDKDNQPAGDPTDPRGNGSQPSQEQLSAAERNPAGDDGGSFYRKTGQGKGRFGARRFSLGGRITRRRAIFGGGMIGTIVTLLVFLTLSSGPLGFIHVAQMMERFHFSHQQNATDDRMGRIYRFARSGGKVGETRLGWLGSKMHANMLADLEKIGIKPVYGRLDTYEGFEIDRSSKASPYKDMSNAELTEALKQKGVNPSEIKINGAKATVSVKGYINQRRSLGFLVDQMGESNIPGSVRVRVMSRYGLVTWHPLKILDKKLNSKLSSLYDNWKSERDEQLATGKEAGSVDGTAAEETDENGKKTPVPAEKTDLTSSKTKEILGGIKDSTGLKVAGGATLGVGVVCTAKSVNENVGNIRYAQVVAPLIRIAMYAIVTGNQIMTGQGVDSTTVSFLAKSLQELDANGNVVSSWSQAAPIQAHEGQTGGIGIESPNDPNQPSQEGILDAIKNAPISWLSWTNGPAVNKLCSTAGQAIAGGIGFLVGVFSGGTVTTAFSAVASALIVPRAIDKISNFLSGEAVNVAGTGAQWGNNVDYGSRLAANTMALQFGGTELNDSQSAELEAFENSKSQAEFNSKSIAYKLFNTYDDRSVASKLIDNTSPSVTQNVNRVASMFMNVGKSFANLSSIFSPKALAAPKPFDYGFNEVGFSQEELNNPLVSDPFANADVIATVLDGVNGGKYTEKARLCFGVDIHQIPDPDDPSKQLWDVVPADKPVNPYDANTYPSDCKNPKNKEINQDDWLRLRFFIMDTGAMEGYACYKGDDMSCANDGFDSTPSDSSISDSGGSLPSGSVKDLASQLMQYVKNDKVICVGSGGFDTGCSDISNTAKGVSIKGGKGCQVDNLQPNLVGMLLELAQMGHTFTLTALCSDHSNDGLGGHSGGRAADFNTIDGQSMGPLDAPWDQAKIVAAFKLDRDIASFMPNSTGFGQQQCHPAFDFLSNFNQFDDSCHHQHVQVVGGE